MPREVDIPLIPGLKYVDEAPPAYARSPIPGLRYVDELPTAGGFVREAGKAALRSAGEAAVSTPLKGFGVAQHWFDLQGLPPALRLMMERSTNKLKDPATKDEGIADLQKYRDNRLYGFEDDQKAAIDTAIKNARKGETDPGKLFQPLEAVKPAPVEGRAAYKVGTAVEDVLKKNLERRPGYDQGKAGIALDVVEAIGSTAGSVAQGAVLGPVGVVGAAALQGMEEQLERARAKGLKGDEAVQFAIQGAGPGVVGALSVEYILRKIPAFARRKLLSVVAETTKSGAAEFVTEGLESVMQNAVERQYNPERGLFDGTIYEASLGGAAGLSVSAVVMAATRGRGVRGGGEQPSVEAVKQELAAEELKLREAEHDAQASGTETGDEASTPAPTPAEAARKGETAVEGKPVTVITPWGDIYHATETGRDPDGGRKVVDREGAQSTVYPDDDFVIKDGWEKVRTEFDVEKDLNEWLSLEQPWGKVTVETKDGKIFRGIEGPQDPGGGRIFRDGDGALRGFAPDALEDVREGWEPGVPWTPDPPVGERAKETSTSGGITEADRQSPIQTETIASGKEFMADAIGVGKANARLDEVGLPNVDKYISFQDKDGNTVAGTVQDATSERIEVITRDGELISAPFDAVKPTLTVLPDFMRGLREVRPDDDTKGRQAGQAGGAVGQGAGDQAKYQGGAAQAARAGRRDTQIQAREKGQVGGKETREIPTQNAGVEGRRDDVATPQERQQEAEEAKEAALKNWWNTADQTNRRVAAVKAGFSEGRRASPQGTLYSQQEWDALPPNARARLLSGNPMPVPEEPAPVPMPAPEPEPAAEPGNGVVSKGVTRTPGGRLVPVTYRVVEADSLIASQDTEGRTNPNYPAELQPRDRSRLMSARQIDKIASRIYPDWLDKSTKTSDGAPIVGNDGVVESGNGRTIALKKAYDSGKADEYRQYLADQGYPIESMKKPVLVRVRDDTLTSEERIKFIRESNVQNTLGMSATEQAFVDIASIPDAMLDLYQGGEISDAINRRFVQDFLSRSVPESEQGKLFGSEGILNKDGLRRVEAAVLAKAYGDQDLVENLVEATDSQIREVSKAIQTVAPTWAKLRAAAADGRIAPAMDQTAALVEAINLIRRARRDGRNIFELVNQRDMLSGGAIDPATEGFLRLMFRDTDQWRKPVSAQRMGESLKFYADEAMKTKAGADMFGNKASSPMEILQRAKDAQERSYGEKQQDLLTAKPKAAPAEQGPVRSPEPAVQETAKPGGAARKEPARPARRVEKKVAAQPKAAPKRALKKKAEAAPAPEPKPEARTDGININDGKPFKSERGAMLAAEMEGDYEAGRYEAVKIEGGWGYRKAEAPKPKPLTKVDKATTTQRSRKTKKEWEEKRALVNTALREGLNKRGLSDVVVNTPDAISDIEGKKAIDDSVVGLSYGNVIEVALAGEHNYWQVMSHETIHVMKRLGLFKPEEWKVLEAKAKADSDMMANIRNRYAGDALTEGAVVEEVIAEQFGDYSAGISKPTGLIGKIYAKVRDFLEALKNALNGNGFKSASDVYAGIESGEIGARPRETADSIQRSESHADLVLSDLRAIEEKPKFARVSDGDFKMVRDLSLFRFYAWTPRTMAGFSRSFARIFNVSKQQDATKKQTIEELGRTYEDYRNLSTAKKRNVNKVLELGRLEQTVYRPSQNGTLTVTASMDTGLMKAGDTVTLDTDETAAYRGVRSMMNLALDKFRDQTVREFGFDPAVIQTPRDALALIVPGMPKGQAGKIRTMSKLLHEINQSKRAGYVPFSRFGNIVTVAEMVNPATGKRTTLHSETFDVPTSRRGWLRKRKENAKIADLERRLMRQYPGADVRTFQVASRDDKRPTGERDILMELTQLHGPALDDAVQKLHKELLAKGFRKHFIAAKNIPGYSLDLEKAIADYVISFSGFTARRQYHAAWEASMRQIPDNKPNEKAYAEDYRQYVNNPQEEFTRVRQAGFMMFLAGNVSNAAANTMQVPLLTGPYLSLFANPARTEIELVRAYKDVTMMLGATTDIFDPNKAPIDVRTALKKAWDEGEFVPMTMHDIMGIAFNAKAKNSKVREAARGFRDGIAMPQTATERANRLVTFIAAYRIAARAPNFQTKALDVLKDHQLAQELLFQPGVTPADFTYEFAKFIVDETQYDTGKINRAKLFRGPGAALFQFKGFIAQTLELHMKTVRLHKGGLSRWGMMIMALFGVGGLRAFPGADDLMWAKEWFWNWWKGEDHDTKAYLRQRVAEYTDSPFAAEMVVHGPVRYLGVDMSDRIGMGKIVPRTLEELGGIPMTLVWGRGVEFWTNVKEGNALKAAMAFSPLWARNPATPYIWQNEGVRTQRGDPVMSPEEISKFDAAAKSMGFNPRTVAERRELSWAQSRVTKAAQEVKSKYYRKLARTITEASEAANSGDEKTHEELMAKFQETMEEIQARNQKNLDAGKPHLLIIIDRPSLQRKVQEEMVGRDVVRAARAPKPTRQRVQELKEIYGQ